MNSLATAFFLLALSLLPGVLAAEGPGPQRPNIVVIFTDDLDFDEINGLRPFSDSALAGKPLNDRPPLTPNLDRLVNESVLFTQFHVVATVCTPSRYALLTGQHGSRSASLQRQHPVTGPANVEFNTDIQPGQWHLARGLKDAGYTVGIVGKWHLTDVRVSDLVVRPPICDYTGKEFGSQDPLLPANATRVRAAYDRAIAYLRQDIGWDFASSIYLANANQLGLPKPLWEHENNMEWFTAGALQFLEQQKDRRKPFFLYLAPNIPHGGGGERFAQANPRATPEGLADWHLGAQPAREDVLRRIREAGANPGLAWATWLDDGIGAILKHLELAAIAQDTLVLFSSDQQTHGKWTCYEGARVPLMLRWPRKIAPGSRNDALLASTDLAPTLLELAGGTLPRPGQAIVDGRSFAPLLRGDALPERPVLIEMGYGRGIVSQGWKYIAVRFPSRVNEKIKSLGRKPNLMGNFQPEKERMQANWPSFGESDQLFHLREDPLERNNLAADPAQAAKLEEMRGQLKQALAQLPHVFGEFKPAPGPAPKP